MTEHPEWFHHRPDGTIKYAENPPKKYQDIYPLNFFGREREALWEEAKGILLFWIEQGVRIFRVDNPHTKPIAFWAWLIAEIQAVHPDVIFLAEAFTRPRVMQALAKVGFTQSYTYFTWRNFKQELTDYLTELTRGEMAEYFRGNFFANTPDILPPILQQGGPPAFRMRLGAGGDALLASTGSTAATSSARTPPFPGPRSTSTRRSTRSRSGTGTRPGTSARTSRGSTGSAGRTGRSTSTGTSSSTRATTSTSSATGSAARTGRTSSSWR